MTVPARKPLLLALVVAAVGLLAIPLVASAPDVIIPGDPAEYRRRVEAIVTEGLPYIDVPFEHLPIMLIPMLAAWFLGGSASQPDFIVLFAAMMTAALATSAVVMEKLGRALGTPVTGWKWVFLVIPSVVLVVFRNDPFVVLLFVIAAYLCVAGKSGWAVMAVAGSLAKVWPFALSVATWSKARRPTLWVAASGVVAGLLTVLPGFTAARRAIGIHAETTVGALLGGLRAATGSDVGLEVTTAAYLQAGWGSIAVNALLGLAVVALGIRAVSGAEDDRRKSLLGVGVIVVGIILASQLLSLQYVLWLTPFLALSTRRRTFAIGIGLAVLTGVLAWIWRPVLFQEIWFFGLLTVRNLMLIVSALWLASEARSPSIS